MQDAEDYSFPTYNAAVQALIGILQPATVLDVGAGAGKYAHLVKAVAPGAHLTALEVGEESIRRHNLGEVYDVVLQETANSMIERQPLAMFDVAILGDVIEHMRKSEGQDFLNWLIYRTGYVIVVTPEAMPMNRDPWYEGHNSVWTERDFHWCDNWACHQMEHSQLFVLRGYQKHPVTMREACARLNAMAIIASEGHAEGAVVLEHRDTSKFTLYPTANPDQVLRVWWREP